MTEELITWLRRELDYEESMAELIPGNGYLPAQWTSHRVPEGEWAEIRQHERWDGMSADDEEVVTAGLMVWGRNEDEHVTHWCPARVVAEVAAKRAILDRCEHWITAQPIGEYDAIAAFAATRDQMIFVLRHLASACASRPGYQERWRP